MEKFTTQAEMSPSDSVSVFAEGTFEEQLQELLEYTSRGIQNEERAALLQSLQDIIKTENASLDEGRRRAALELVLKNTKGVGQGTDQGKCGHDRSRSFLTRNRDRGILQPLVLASIHSVASRFVGNKTTCSLSAQGNRVFAL